MKLWLGNRPWIWIVLFYLAFLGAWTGFIIVAVRHSPEVVKPEAGTVLRGHES